MNRLSLLKNFYIKTPTSIQVNMLKMYNKSNSKSFLIQQSNFLKKELPIRLSHRVLNLIKLPYGLPNVKEIKDITNLYIDSFDEIVNFENINCMNSVEKFTKLLCDIKYKHTDLEFSMSKGIQNIDNYDLVDLNILNKELDNFFLSRLGIRTLINHQIGLIEHGSGVIKECNINNIIQKCCNDLDYMTSRIYTENVSDYIKISGNTELKINYIPEHIHYIIMEILKNAVIASYDISQETFDDININFTEGKHFIIIKISDRGKSFSKSKLNEIFSYSYSTYPVDITDEYEVGNIPIIGGLGFGLPMSKIYCKYFNGDLIICPMENYGTDVYIYINKLGNNKEVLYLK